MMYNEKLSFWQTLALRVRGRAYIGHERKAGWSGDLPFYVAVCPEHGLVKTYPSGGRGRLQCPLCKERNVIARV